MARFKDKVVIVTGATAGIGKGGALGFAKEGAKVVVVARRQEEGEAFVKELKEMSLEATFVQADVSKEAEVKHMVDETLRIYGRLDYAFNNAGKGGRVAPITDLEESDWDDVLEVNLKSVWLCMKYQIPAMLKNPESEGGAIVNMSSLWGIGASAMGLSPYIASKHAVVGLTRAAALEYAPKNIRINCINPAWVKTEGNSHILDDPQQRSHIESLHPVGRLGTTEEMAESVMFLCSPGAGFITGQCLVADGGISVNC